MTALVKQLLDKYRQRKAERTTLNRLWEEIAEVLPLISLFLDYIVPI